jgi:hypothetical protein
MTRREKLSAATAPLKQQDCLVMHQSHPHSLLHHAANPRGCSAEPFVGTPFAQAARRCGVRGQRLILPLLPLFITTCSSQNGA